MTKENVAVHLDNLNLPPEAKEWLLDTWDVIQALDDWRDGDPVSNEDKEKTIYQVMVNMPANQFFRAYSHCLLPIMSTAVLKWIGANKLEESKEELGKAYMWRAAYYDLVLETVRLVHGYIAAAKSADYIARMYGENFDEYVKEFEDA